MGLRLGLGLGLEFRSGLGYGLGSGPAFGSKTGVSEMVPQRTASIVSRRATRAVCAVA